MNEPKFVNPLDNFNSLSLYKKAMNSVTGNFLELITSLRSRRCYVLLFIATMNVACIHNDDLPPRSHITAEAHAYS